MTHVSTCRVSKLWPNMVNLSPVLSHRVLTPVDVNTKVSRQKKTRRPPATREVEALCHRFVAVLLFVLFKLAQSYKDVCVGKWLISCDFAEQSTDNGHSYTKVQPEDVHTDTGASQLQQDTDVDNRGTSLPVWSLLVESFLELPLIKLHYFFSSRNSKQKRVTVLRRFLAYAHNF